MEVESILVTGVNRGIGLEFVRQLVNLPKPPRYVFATYWSKYTVQALENIKKESAVSQVFLVEMDVNKTEDVVSARKFIEKTVGDKGLNLLINNAAVFNMVGFPAVTKENFIFHFTTNTVGPIQVLKEMLPLLQKASAHHGTGKSASRAAVLNISSMGGSIGGVIHSDFLEGIGYRTSKTALNMAMRIIAVTVKDQGILITNMCPGWVRTDIGTDSAALHVTESVSSMLKTLPTLNDSHHGAFLDRNGNTIPF